MPVSFDNSRSTTFTSPSKENWSTPRKLDRRVFKLSRQRGQIDSHVLSFTLFLILLQGLVDSLLSRKIINDHFRLVVHIVVLYLKVNRRSYRIENSWKGSVLDSLVNTPTRNDQELGVDRPGISSILHDNHHFYVPHGRVMMSLKAYRLYTSLGHNFYFFILILSKRSKYIIMQKLLPSFNIMDTLKLEIAIVINKVNIIKNSFNILSILEYKDRYFGLLVEVLIYFLLTVTSSVIFLFTVILKGLLTLGLLP